MLRSGRSGRSGEQVAAGGPVGAPLGVRQERHDPRVVIVADDRGPDRLADHLSLVLPQSRDTRGQQEVPHGGVRHSLPMTVRTSLSCSHFVRLVSGSPARSWGLASKHVVHFTTARLAADRSVVEYEDTALESLKAIAADCEAVWKRFELGTGLYLPPGR